MLQSSYMDLSQTFIHRNHRGIMQKMDLAQQKYRLELRLNFHYRPKEYPCNESTHALSNEGVDGLKGRSKGRME